MQAAMPMRTLYANADCDCQRRLDMRMQTISAQETTLLGRQCLQLHGITVLIVAGCSSAETDFEGPGHTLLQIRCMHMGDKVDG